MKQIRPIPAWPSFVLVAIIIAISAYAYIKLDLYCSRLIITLSPIGLIFIGIPYVVQTDSITSTWRDKVDERRFRIIGYVILIAVLISVLIALYDYQKNYQDRDEFYYDRYTQKIVPKEN